MTKATHILYGRYYLSDGEYGLDELKKGSKAKCENARFEYLTYPEYVYLFVAKIAENE